MAKCFSCSNSLDNLLSLTIGRGETCEKCDSDVRCCYNCSHFDQSSYNSCAEPQADRVVDKDRSNFCDYFKLGESSYSKSGDSSKDEALKKLDDIFK